MSHFTVLVIGDDIEGQLAPYQENNCDDCPRQFLEFEDREDEYIEEYNNGTIDQIKMSDGTYKSPYDEQFKKFKDVFDYSWDYGNNELVNVPIKDVYASVEKYVKDYHGSLRDDETGRFGYWHNPNSKWDWYSVGGRWTGFFKLKKGKKGEVGSPGVLTKPAKKGWVDSALKSDIDFEGMRDKAGLDARNRYEKVTTLFGGSIPKLTYLWNELKGDINERRNIYHSQNAIKLLEALEKTTNIRDYLSWSLELEEFQCSIDEFEKHARENAFTTFAIVKDGVWYERGSMGWWGMVADEKDDSVWNSEFSKLLDDLSDDTLLTVVDCHI